MQVWNAYKEAWQEAFINDDTSTDVYREAMAIVRSSQEALMRDADKRRGPSRVKPNSYFKVVLTC